MDEYQPVKGVAGNCKPPISVSSHDTPGNGYHSNSSFPIAVMLIKIKQMFYWDIYLASCNGLDNTFL